MLNEIEIILGYILYHRRQIRSQEQLQSDTPCLSPLAADLVCQLTIRLIS